MVFFSSCSIHSCSLSPGTSHQLHLLQWFLEQRFCPYALANRGTCGNWGMTSGHTRVAVFLLICPVSFSVVGQNCRYILWQWIKNNRRLPDTVYVHLFLITSGKRNSRAEGVRRMSVCCQVPRGLKKAVEPTLQCHLGVGGRRAQPPWMKTTL